MSTIFLVRHTKYNNPNKIVPGRLPLKLSKEGVEQANVLHNYFVNKNIAQIYSSPILRCKQTSEIIAGGSIPLKFDIRIAETLSANQGNKEVGNWRKEFYCNVSTLGGESPEDVQKRMIDFWMTANFQPNKNYIICSHGDPLFFLYQFLKKQPLHSDLNINSPENYQSKGSVRVVEYASADDIEVYPCIDNENL
jgi:broad specificity phosphatase PhoE